MKKVKIAKEWLLFLGFTLVIGFIVVPIISKIFFYTFRYYWSPNFSILVDYKEFISVPFRKSTGQGESIVFWSMVLGPYVIFLIIRSIFWSINLIRTAE